LRAALIHETGRVVLGTAIFIESTPAL
jgi:hypothetical protein